MKFSVKLPDHHPDNCQPPLLLRAKIPITIFNLPFLSHFSTTTAHPSDLSISLSSNFPSGPSLKFSYATASSAAAAVTAPPLSVILKSGTGLFGSPTNSPLVISACFSFNPSNPNNPNPTFSLFFKPQLGSFSLRKSTFSHPESNFSGEHTCEGDATAGVDSTSFGFVPVKRSLNVKELLVEKNDRDAIFKGIQLAAKTEVPLATRASLNFRWLVNFSEDQMPVLRINKIGIQRVNDVGDPDDQKQQKKANSEGNGGEREVEVLKGMCCYMKRELDVLTRVNKEMKDELELMKAQQNNSGEFRDDLRRKFAENSSNGFEQWRSKRKGGGERGESNGKKEEKMSSSHAIDVENELQRAIKAATSSP